MLIQLTRKKRKVLTLMLVSIIFVLNKSFSQTDDLAENDNLEESLNTPFKMNIKGEGIKANEKDQKISFIAGVGGSYILKDLYQSPAVDLSTKNVILEKAQNFKSNISFGIAYTGKTLKLRDGTRVPYGRTIVAFINPVSFNQVTDNQSFFDMVDFGFGIGHKFAGSMMILGTIEFFNVRQPRDWFITEYQNNDSQFLIDGAPQVSFDVKDNNIFKNKMAATIGLKLCYTFDIIKSYKESGDQTDQE